MKIGLRSWLLKKGKASRTRSVESPSSQSRPSFLPLGLPFGQEILIRFDLERA
jgi:hypothetical protein